jgi:hypothetical protein
MAKYFIIKCRYKDRGSSWHLIRAESKEDALRIREKYGISYPRYATDMTGISCLEVSMDWPEYYAMRERRRKGQGGSVWYEEDGELKTESE